MTRHSLEVFFLRKTCAVLYLSSLMLWLIVSGPCLATNAIQDHKEAKETTKDQVEGAASEPEATVSVAEPNIGALLGIGGGLAGNQGLLAGFNSRSLSGGGAGLNLPSSISNAPDLRSICNNGNPDALTNLLVYQYLSGGLPNGAPGISKLPPPGAASNPHLQALFDGPLHDPTLKTSTSVTTGLTTRTVSLEPKTQVSTSTSVYVTTITAVSTSIIPIVFRGSTITTTITEKKTDVLTATEFLTDSKVLTPSIVQTLPLEITLIHKSTLGLNGRYTLDHVAPGPTRVIEKPINTASFDLKNHGIDLSSIDFSPADLKGLNGGDSDMLNALSALLEQYSDGPREKKRNDRYQLRREKPRQSRFQNREKITENDEDPKISVLKGFTLRDREQRPRQKESSPSGTAAFNTRYSKFLKKPKLKNNSLQPQEPDRESEPFSASTSRRTVSSAQRRRNVPHHGPSRSSRFQPTGRSISSGSNPRTTAAAVRRNRHIEERVNRRRSGRTLSVKPPPRRNPINAIKTNVAIKTTTAVLTLRIHGSTLGAARTVLRTITLGTFDPTQRLRRHISVPEPEPPKLVLQTEMFQSPATPEISPEDVVQLLKKVDTIGLGTFDPTQRLRRHTSVSEPELSKLVVQTEMFQPPVTPEISPEDVVQLLKKVDKKNVQIMLGSLKKWVDYYMKEVLDEDPDTSVFPKDRKDVQTNEIPELTSSIANEVLEVQESAFTAALPSLPEQLTKSPSTTTESSSQPLCLHPHTLTTTVYKTLYLSQP